MLQQCIEHDFWCREFCLKKPHRFLGLIQPYLSIKGLLILKFFLSQAISLQMCARKKNVSTMFVSGDIKLLETHLNKNFVIQTTLTVVSFIP